MCTAISYKKGHHYFGRNLDLEYSYGETVTVTPRHYPFSFRCRPVLRSHYAMIGMTYVRDGYPLYYDAVNEKGLGMAGLSFWDFAAYHDEVQGKDNIAPFEFIPWILGQCETVDQVKTHLARINLVNIPFSDKLPLSPLHWIISDRESSIVVESTKDGVQVFDNPLGVLTNSPPFEYHCMHLNDYMGLSNQPAENRFSGEMPLKAYSRGMGGMGLPGDYSSASRFVRAAFVKQNSVCGSGDEEGVSQFFHILASVAHPKGCVDLGEGKYEITVYSSCCDTDRGIYYYTTYHNSAITAVDMHREDLDGKELISYPMITRQRITFQNRHATGEAPG